MQRTRICHGFPLNAGVTSHAASWTQVSSNNNKVARQMAQQASESIIAELEDAVRDGTSTKRVQTLRRVTDLFLNDGDRLNDEQVKVFDDVLCLLVARVETRARAELSKRLAPLDYAPFEGIPYLAWDDDIAVAGEVLTHSNR